MHPESTVGMKLFSHYIFVIQHDNTLKINTPAVQNLAAAW
jgi:hypothetical protein